jgi:hypothetical protein
MTLQLVHRASFTCAVSGAVAAGCSGGEAIGGSATGAVLGVAAATGAGGGGAAAVAEVAAAAVAGTAPGSAGLLRMSASRPITCGASR